MHKIEISDEIMDAIIKDTLVKDYIGFINRVKQLEAIENPEPWQQEDLDNERHYLAAMKTMLTYYMDFDSYTELFRETANSI
jgi:hypothetical protein